MYYPMDHPDTALQRVPKGIKQVLIERDLWEPGMRLACRTKCTGLTTTCCARYCLSQQHNFLEQRGQLQEEVEAAGHLVLFYPKFHCELNFIELFWALHAGKL